MRSLGAAECVPNPSVPQARTGGPMPPPIPKNGAGRCTLQAASSKDF